MTGKPKVEWRAGADFNEFAQAVGVPTDHVMLVHEMGDRWEVFYNVEEYEVGKPVMIYSQALRRSPGGVLARIGLRREHPDMWEQVEKAAGERIREKFGDGGA